MEFIEFGKCLEFHGRRLRKQVAGCNGVLNPLQIEMGLFVGSGGLTATVTRSILPSEEDRHGGAREEAYNVSGCRSFRCADSIGVPKSQRSVLVNPASQPK